MVTHPAQWPPLAVMFWGVVYFATIYVTAGVLGRGITRMLAARGVGAVLDSRSMPPDQIAREWRASAVSVVIFGLGLVVLWWMVRQGWASVDVHASLPRCCSKGWRC